jgi:hypothetical protein
VIDGKNGENRFFRNEMLELIVIPACPESFLFPLNKGGEGGCLMKSLTIVRTFLRSFPRRRGSNLAENGCPTEDLGHDGLRIESVNTI